MALAFRATQIVPRARALLSDQLLQNVLTPGLSGRHAAAEQHYLFPKAWLARHKITDRREINQVGWRTWQISIGERRSAAGTLESRR